MLYFMPRSTSGSTFWIYGAWSIKVLFYYHYMKKKHANEMRTLVVPGEDLLMGKIALRQCDLWTTGSRRNRRKCEGAL